MSAFKNKFFIVALITVTIVIIVFLLMPKKNIITKNELKSWIQVGYAKQFCEVIYPNIASCLTMDQEQCIPFASQQIQPCIEYVTKYLSDVIANEDSKSIYNSVGACFSQNMRNGLLQQYLIQTPECREKFS